LVRRVARPCAVGIICGPLVISGPKYLVNSVEIPIANPDPSPSSFLSQGPNLK